MNIKEKFAEGNNVVDINSDLTFDFVNGKDIQAKPQPWLWPGIIPDHTVTLFAGEGGIGKSQLLLEIAAKISTGEKFKAGGFDHELPQGKVLILSAEDDLEYQIKPKLIAANANYSEINFLKFSTIKNSKNKKYVDLTLHLNQLENHIAEQKNVRLIIVDPVLYFIGEIRENVNSEVSNFLGTLSEFARTNKLAIVINKHFRKKSSGITASNAVDEVGGAAAWVNSPRLAWAIARHHENQDLIVLSKMKVNITKLDSECLAYQIKETQISIHDGPVIHTTFLDWWPEMIKLTANEAINKEKYESSKLEQAYQIIVDYLKERGQSVAKHVKDHALKLGAKLKTFEYAVRQLKDDKRLKIDPGTGGNKLWTLITEEDCD